MKTQTAIADINARQRALDIHSSFAVSAPAGSGKTGLLTQRVLALLAQAQEPENILAITFTRKAAAEMQTRIINAISSAAIQDEPQDDFQKQTWLLAKSVLERDQKKQWKLLECPNRLRITTIDSLCRSISERMPFDSNLGSIPDILDSPAIAYEMASREILKNIHKNHELQDDLIRLVKHVDNNLGKIETLFAQLLAKRDQWLGIILQSEDQRLVLENMLEAVVTQELQLTREILAPIASELSLLIDHAAGNFQKPELNPKNTDSYIRQCWGLKTLPFAEAGVLSQWRGISELLLTQSGKLRAKPTKDIGFFAPSNKSLSKEEKETAKYFKERMETLLTHCREIPELEAQLAIVQTLPSPHYEENQWQLLNSLTRILRHLAGELQLAFQQLGKTDYLSITLAAIDALGNSDTPSDLALSLDYQIQHILVDEFQDTSTTQLLLLQALTRGWQTGDGRTLFVVGDAMQSCYRFRDANVGIFLDIREKGLGDIVLEPLDLEVNFRSNANIVDWVNTQFTEIFPLQNNSTHSAVAYKPSMAHKPLANDSSTQTHLLSYNKDSTEKPDQSKYIVNLIKQHQKNDSNASIAVLVRAKNHAQNIIDELMAENIDYRATEIDQLSTCMPIQDLLSLTRALLYPDDRMAWLALLRAPWCGLSMEDLFTISTMDEQPLLITIKQYLSDQLSHQSNQALSEQGQKKLQRFYHVIYASLQQQYRFSLHQWVYRTWLQLGGPALLLNANDQNNIDSFFELLAKMESGGTIKEWKQVEIAVEKLFSQQTPASHNPVEIMTIHKSKGLEFDIVILPALEKKSPSADKELIRWMETLGKQNNRLLLLSPIHAKGRNTDPLYEYIHQQHKNKDSLETDRVLYVACTRAIKNLHLIANIEKNEDNEIKSPEKSSLLYHLWNKVGNKLEGKMDSNVGIKVKSKVEEKVENNENIIIVPDNTVNEKAQKKTTNDKNISAIDTSAHQHPNCIVSLNAQWQPPEFPKNALLQKYRGNNQLADISGDNIAKPDALLQKDQRYIGIVIHMALQHITESGYTHWNTERINKQRPIWRAQLLQQGISPKNINKALDTVIFAATTTLKDSKGQWILDNTHPQSATELVIWNQYGQHIIDRTFLETTTNNQSIRWIIDYKSSQEDDIDSMIKKYQTQLQRYGSLFEKENSKVRMAVYFPLTALWLEV